MSDATQFNDSTIHDETAAYEAALDYLYSFINFEQKKQDRYMASKLDASRPERLMAALGSPQDQFPSIHIAGTKGKGSVAMMCAACLRAAGYRVGLYTSPHLQDFRERIRILTPADPDGRVAKNRFVALMDELKPALDQFPDITWFEILTAIAFLHFARERVDVAVVEVGLGGRLDSTNVLTPLVSVITSLSLDHTKLLGNTLSQIAYEKGGIIKPRVPVVTASQSPEAMNRLLAIAAEREAPISVIGQNWCYEGGERHHDREAQELIITYSPDDEFIPRFTSFTLGLVGAHQLENGAVALAALHQVRSVFPQLDLAAIHKGLAGVVWHGRLELIHPGDENTPALLVDCAHNPDSAAKLYDALTQNFSHQRLWLIFGAPADKDIPAMLATLLPLAAGTITTTASHPRSATPEDLAETCRNLGYEATPAHTMADALTMAWQTAVPGDLICVTGSIIVVGDLLNQWESLQSQLLPTYAATTP